MARLLTTPARHKPAGHRTPCSWGFKGDSGAPTLSSFMAGQDSPEADGVSGGLAMHLDVCAAICVEGYSSEEGSPQRAPVRLPV